MDQLGWFFQIIGRDLGAGLEEVARTQLEAKKRQELMAAQTRQAMMSQLFERSLALMATPGFAVLTDEEKDTFRRALGTLVAGQWDEGVIQGIGGVAAKVAKNNEMGQLIKQLLTENNVEGVAKLFSTPEEAEKYLNAFGFGAFAPAVANAIPRVRTQERIGLARQLIDFAASGRITDRQSIAAIFGEDVANLVPESILQLNQLGLSEAETDAMRNVVRLGLEADVADEGWYAQQLERLGVAKERVAPLAQAAAGAVRLERSRTELSLMSGLGDLVVKWGYEDPQAIMSLAQQYNIRLTEAQAKQLADKARQANEEQALAIARQRLVLNQAQLEAAKSIVNTFAVGPIREALEKGAEPNWDGIKGMLGTMLGRVGIGVDNDALSALLADAYRVAQSQVTARRNELLALAQMELQLLDDLPESAAQSGMTEAQFRELLQRYRTPSGEPLSQMAAEILVSRFKAAGVAKAESNNEKLWKFVAALPVPTDEEALLGNIALVRKRAQELNIDPEGIIQGLINIWHPHVRRGTVEALKAVATDIVALAKAGVQPEQIKASVPQEYHGLVDEIAEKVKQGETLEIATQIPGLIQAYAKHGVRKEVVADVLKELGLTDGEIKDWLEGYDSLLLLQRYGYLNTIARLVLDTSLTKEDARRLLRGVYDQISKDPNLGTRVANAVADFVYKSLELRKAGEDLKALEEQVQLLETWANAQLKLAQAKKASVEAQRAATGTDPELEYKERYLNYLYWVGKLNQQLARERLQVERERLQARREELQLERQKLAQKFADAPQELLKVIPTLQKIVDTQTVFILRQRGLSRCVDGTGAIRNIPECSKAFEEATKEAMKTPAGQLLQELMDPGKPLGEIQPLPVPSGKGSTVQPPAAGGVRPIAYFTQKQASALHQLHGVRGVGAINFLAVTENPQKGPNALQAKGPNAHIAQRCAEETWESQALCQARALWSQWEANVINNGTLISVRHFLPAAATNLDLSLSGILAGNRQLSAEAVVAQNPALHEPYVLLSGRKPTANSFTGRDIAAGYAYKAILHYGKDIGGSLGKVISLGNESSKGILALIAYAATHLGPRLGSSLSPQAAEEAVRKAARSLSARGFGLTTDDRSVKFFAQLLVEAFPIINVDLLGKAALRGE